MGGGRECAPHASRRRRMAVQSQPCAVCRVADGRGGFPSPRGGMGGTGPFASPWHNEVDGFHDPGRLIGAMRVIAGQHAASQ